MWVEIDKRFAEITGAAIGETYLCTRQISQNPYPIRVLPS